jgi:hypothetical protein
MNPRSSPTKLTDRTYRGDGPLATTIPKNLKCDTWLDAVFDVCPIEPVVQGGF